MGELKLKPTDRLLFKAIVGSQSYGLISIIHYFSMKSYYNRRKLNKIKQELLTN